MDAGIVWLAASDGKQLAYRMIKPDGDIRATVLVVHGMNDHSLRFMPLAEALASCGYAVYLPDLRGHGDTDTGDDRGHLGKNSGLDRVVQDLFELAQHVKKLNESLPLFLVGHSFGALVSFIFAGSHGTLLSGLVLSGLPCKQAPLLDIAGRAIIAIAMAVLSERSPGNLPRAMTFGAYGKQVKDSRTGSDWISRDSQIVDAYIADPKCAFVCSYGFYHELARGVREIYAPEFLASFPKELPILSLAGSSDPVAGFRQGFESGLSIFKAAGIVSIESSCYPDSRHEILNDLDRQQVMGDINAWIARHIAQPSRKRT